jgi:hypothetical protein
MGSRRRQVQFVAAVQDAERGDPQRDLGFRQACAIAGADSRDGRRHEAREDRPKDHESHRPSSIHFTPSASACRLGIE